MDKKKQKTILEDLLEKYPNVLMDDDGTPLGVVCPSDLGIDVAIKTCSSMSCYDCWTQPLPEKK